MHAVRVAPHLGNVLVALPARFPSLEPMQVVLVNEVLNVALHERWIYVEKVPKVLLDLMMRRRR